MSRVQRIPTHQQKQKKKYGNYNSSNINQEEGTWIDTCYDENTQMEVTEGIFPFCNVNDGQKTSSSEMNYFLDEMITHSPKLFEYFPLHSKHINVNSSY